MPSQRFESTLAAGITDPNILAGSQFEFMAAITRVQVYMVGNVSGGSYDTEVLFGQQLELPIGPGPEFTDALGPNVPDHIILDAIAAPGDRLAIRLTNTDGALASVTRTLIVLTPV